jgi:hypothetical protein
LIDLFFDYLWSSWLLSVTPIVGSLPMRMKQPASKQMQKAIEEKAAAQSWSGDG